MLLSGLAVLARLPPTAGGAWPVPVADGVNPGPWGWTTWLLPTSTGMSRIDVSLPRRHAGQRIDTSKNLLAFDHLGHGLGPQGAADHVVHVGHLHAPPLAFFRVDAERQVRLPQDVEDSHVLQPGHVLHDVLGLRCRGPGAC